MKKWLDKYKSGGNVNSLNRKVTCSNCGWSWKLSDGGMDPMTCHKCGGDIKMQQGGELDEYQDRGQVNFRDQLFPKQKPIVDRGNFSNIKFTSQQADTLKKVKEKERLELKNQLKQEQSARAAKEKGLSFTLPTGKTKTYNQMSAKERAYVDAQVLRNKGRWNENSVDQPLLNMFNPITMVYDMAAGIGEAPIMSDVSGSYLPYVTGIGIPLVTGALSSVGTKTTGQFVNNIVNPLAGLGDVAKNVAQKTGRYFTQGRLRNTYKYINDLKKFKNNLGNFTDKTAVFELATSPKTLKALSQLDDPIAQSMISDYVYKFKGEKPTYNSIDDFRLNVKKAMLNQNRIKKLYSDADFTPYGANMTKFLLNDPKKLEQFIIGKKWYNETIKNRDIVSERLVNSFNKKINLINQNPLFKNIIDESPQYIDEVYEHLSNPKMSDDDFVTNLVKQANTFTRSVRRPRLHDDQFENILEIKGTKNNRETGNNYQSDVEGFPVSMDYGPETYAIFPNEASVKEIQSIPLEQRWAKRSFDNLSTHNPNIKIYSNLNRDETGVLNFHSDAIHPYDNFKGKRLQRAANQGIHEVIDYYNIGPGVDLKKHNIPSLYKQYFYHRPQHFKFGTDLENQILTGFDTRKLGSAEKPFKKFLYHPGFTHGYKNGGPIVTNRGQVDFRNQLFQQQKPIVENTKINFPKHIQQIPIDPFTHQPLTREQIQMQKFVTPFNKPQPTISQGTWKGNRKTKDNSFDPYLRIIKQDPESEANIGKRKRKELVTKKLPAALGAATGIVAAPTLMASAAPYISAPLTVGATTVPWLTPGTMIGAGFGLHGANQLGNQVSSGYYSSNAPTSEKILTGLTTGLDMLGMPGAVEGLAAHVVSPLYRGALKTGNYLTTHPLRNTYKYNPLAIKENPEMFLYRTQPKDFVAGYTEEQQLKDLITDKILKGEKIPFWLQAKLNKIKYEPEPFRKALNEYHGQWFDKNPERMDFYMKGRLDGDEGNILRLKVPKEEGLSYNLKNFPEAQKASLNYDTEFIVPRNKINESEIFSTNNWQELIQQDKAFNTPHWWRGYKKEVSKPTSNINLQLFGFGRKKPIVSEVAPLSQLEKQALVTQEDLARANRDAITFSQSPANRAKLQEFRPGQDFSITNQQARFIDDPEALKLYESYKLENDPSLSIEQYLGGSRGQYGARDYGDLNDVVLIDKNQPFTSNIPSRSAYTDAMHETTHSRSIRLGATDAEKEIASDAWSPMIKKNNFGMPEEEAFAVQNELRTDKLKDIKGDRVYTEKDIPEIKKGLQEMINEGHDYLRNVNIEDFNIPALIKSLNKIGLGAAVIGIGGKAALQQEKNGGAIITNRGQWDYPGQTTIIPSNKITMTGVDYPVLGVDNTGYTKMMQPGMDYTFPGQYVTEYPMMQGGGEMIKRADGSYSRRGLWDNLRDNRGSGKKPTKQMLEQERKIRNKKQDGGEEYTYWRTQQPMVNDPSMDAISKVLLQRNLDKNFMQRAAGFGYQGGIPTRYIPGQDPDSDAVSTLLMSFGDNQVFPTIIQTGPNQLSYQPYQTQEYLEAPTWNVADYFATKGYKRAANDMYGMEYKNGGYVVKSGDTLSKIARSTGVSIRQLTSANNLANPNLIRVNQKLVIPAVGGTQPEQSYQNWDDIRRRQDELNALQDNDMYSGDEQRINQYYTNRPDDSYIVIDKKRARMNVYKGNKLQKTYEVGTGANPGDAQTVTRRINGKTDWDSGNRSTGAGVYTISNIDPKSHEYFDLPAFNLKNDRGIEVATTIHGTPMARRAKFDNNNIADNRMSYGCINGKCYDLKDLYGRVDVGSKVYILPEDEGNTMQIVDGKPVLKVNPKNRAKYLQYTDKTGKVQKGQGINQSVNTLQYKPIMGLLDRKSFMNDVYKSFDTDDEEEYKKNTKPYFNSLVNNKKKVMQATNIPSDIYNEIAKISFGIYGAESNFGDENNPINNTLKTVAKVKPISSLFQSIANFKPTIVTDDKIGGPDVRFKASLPGALDSNKSVGFTQIRWSELNKDEKDVLKKLGILSNKDFLDPEKAAMATTAILAVRYNQQLNDNQKKDIWKHLPGKWNKRANYADRVKKNSKYITFKQYDSKYQDGGETYAIGGQSTLNPIVKKDNRNWLDFLKN